LAFFVYLNFQQCHYFAYAIHTDIGNHASSSTINGKNAALNTKLKNNDIVEVQVNKNAKPSSKWL